MSISGYSLRFESVGGAEPALVVRPDEFKLAVGGTDRSDSWML